jgi:hypothetical protein
LPRPRKLKKSSIQKKKDLAVDISEAGQFTREIYNDIVNGLNVLEPIDGSITIEIDLLLKDNNLFKDDELRKAKATIHVNLKKKSNLTQGDVQIS